MEPYRETIEGPLAWTVADVASKERLTRRLAPAHLDAIDAVLAKVRGKQVEAITRNDVAEPALVRFMRDVMDDVQNGFGIVVIAGCDLERHSRDDFARIFWAMGRLLGNPVSQSSFGELIAHVRHTPDNPNNRTYRTTRELIPHTDTPDVLGLMCVQQAKSGGLSTSLSALALHNEILRTRPDLLAPLYRGFPYHRLGQQLPEQPQITPYGVPIFSHVDGVVSCMYVRHMMTRAAQALGRELPADLVAAMDYFDTLAADSRFALHYALAPGDIFFINNRTALHSRTEYVDHDEPERKRDLLRLWIDLPVGRRPVTDHMDPYQHPTSGGRGGVAPQRLAVA